MENNTNNNTSNSSTDSKPKWNGQNYLDSYKTFIPSNPQPTDLKKKRKPRGPKPVINEEYTRITRSRSRYEAFLKSQPPTSTEAIIVPISPVKPKENEKSVKMIRRKSKRIQNAASEMCQNQKKYIRALSEIQSVKVVNDDDEWEIKPCENHGNDLIPMPIKIMRRKSTANSIILNQTFNDDTGQNSTVVNTEKASKLKRCKSEMTRSECKMPKLTRIPKPFPPIPVPSPPIPLLSPPIPVPKLTRIPVPFPPIPPYNPFCDSNNNSDSLENTEDLNFLENTEDGLEKCCATCFSFQTSEDIAGINCDTCNSWHHLKCVKLDSQVGKNQWYCPECYSKKSSTYCRSTGNKSQLISYTSETVLCDVPLLCEFNNRFPNSCKVCKGTFETCQDHNDHSINNRKINLLS